MPTLTFRNSEGALVDIPTVAATQVENELGAILDKVTRVGAVTITHHGTPKAVLLSCKEFDSLVEARSRKVSRDFGDFLDRMQRPRAKKAMNTAFNASPIKPGRAARQTSPKLR
jgi:antitoxin Phd